MTHFLEDYGLIVLFLVVALQAMGVGGLPGKAVLVTAAILAARGHFSIESVIVVGTVALIVGGYAGYWIGRLGGRRIVDRFLSKRLERVLALADGFFDKHGPKAVFMARFVPALKVVAAPAAGIARMQWRKFALWHALAAITLTLAFGLGAYFAGEAAVTLVEHYGLYALAPLLVVVAGIAYAFSRRGRPLIPAAIRRQRSERLRARRSS
jgi:membrane protein DedA with SNARE-associated domain